MPAKVAPRGAIAYSLPDRARQSAALALFASRAATLGHPVCPLLTHETNLAVVAAGNFVRQEDTTMKRLFMMSAVGGLALGLLASGEASAQIVAGTSEPEITAAAPAPAEPRQVEGKVVDVQQTGRMITMLRLDTGAAVTLPETSGTSAASPKVGDDVVAHLVDTNGESVATFVRIIEAEAP
jgi:hypothetical protein